MQFKKTAIALAVSSFCVSGVASAENYYGAREEVEFTKSVNIEEDLSIYGNVDVHGRIQVRNSALAITDTDQTSNWNTTDYEKVDNSAVVGGEALKGASGNIGLNVGSGDNNVQANSMAIAITGPYKAGGAADAETFLFQDTTVNDTDQWRVTNEARISGAALNGAAGKIGVNIAAGTSNVQANSTAIAMADDSLLSTSTARTNHASYDNYTWSGHVTNTASLTGSALSGAKGNIGVNIAAGNNNAQSNSLAVSYSSYK